MKKMFFSIMMVLVVITLVSGCGGSDAEITEEATPAVEEVIETPTTIDGALSSVFGSKDFELSDEMIPSGGTGLVVDTEVNDFMAKDSAYADCYDSCEALKDIPELQGFEIVTFNFNGESLLQDGTTQMVPVIRLRYTTEQINNFDFESRNYVGFEGMADVIKMDVK